MMMLYSIFTMGLWLIASVRTAVMAATCIAREKEARTWPILLGTTLEDWQIIRGKGAVVLWRNSPAWLALAVNSVAIFIFMRMFGRWGGSGGEFFYIISGLFGIVAYAAFLIGAGLYFSARLKSTTAAVISTVGSALGLYIVHRFLFSVVVRLIMMTGFMMRGFGLIILYSFVPSIFYLVAGLLLLWRAKCRLRQNIF